MATKRIKIPEFRGRRFTTEETEKRIEKEKKEREENQKLRDRRQKDREADSCLDIEIQKQNNLVDLRDSLLRELANRENTYQGFGAASEGIPSEARSRSSRE